MTSMFVGGSERLLPPLSPITLPGPLAQRLADRARLGRLVDSHVSSRTEQKTVWDALVVDIRTAGVLRITVFGVSVSNGARACDFRMGSQSPAALGPRANSTCGQHEQLFSMAWARQFQDIVTRVLQPLRVRLALVAKNAVGPSYFASCTTSKLRNDTHIVLLEMASNLYESPGEMLERIHVAAPRAAVAFINWGCSPRARIDDRIQSAASAAHVDVLNGAALLHELVDPIPCHHFYGLRGHDHIHPNAAGHALLAAAAAQFVINRMEAPRQPAHLVNARPLLRSKAPFEHCYEDAAHLPVVPMSMSNTSGWRLVDDGRDKGVAKLGWKSTTVGQVLSLGPLEGPPDAKCALLEVTLGYLLTMSSTQGALLLRCQGCRCQQEQSITSVHNPFPRVQTDASLASNQLEEGQ